MKKKEKTKNQWLDMAHGMDRAHATGASTIDRECNTHTLCPPLDNIRIMVIVW